MLGLNNTISSLGTSSSAVIASRGSGGSGSSEPDPLFLSSVIPANFFTPDSIQGTLSLTADQSAPDGSGGWLKGVFSQDQTSFSGLLHNDFDGDITGGLVSGDSYKISFDFFLNSGTNGNGETFWPSAPTTTTMSLGGRGPTQDISPGSATLWEQTLSSISRPDYNDLYIFWNYPSSDRPHAGATFYMKNLKVVAA
jgi:hypothetical protein